MKTSNSKTDSQKLAGTVQMARLRVATAESQWKAARRRRKETKRLARRARKQAKQAKAVLAEFRMALAKAEAKLAESGARLATRKPARTKVRPVVKSAVTAPKKKAAPVRLKHKEVKPVARHAKKQVKADTVGARKAPTKAKAKLAESGVRVATRKPIKAKARPVAKSAVTAPKKIAAPVRLRRKEVKPVARHAKKQVKADTAGARKSPTKAKARPVAKGVVTAPKKIAVPTSKGQTVPSAPSPAPWSAVPVTPASLQENAPATVPAQAGPATVAPKTPEPPATNP